MDRTNQIVELDVATKIRNGWKRDKVNVSFQVAVKMIKNTWHKTYKTTKMGGLVVTGLNGNISTILALKQQAGIDDKPPHCDYCHTNHYGYQDHYMA